MVFSLVFKLMTRGRYAWSFLAVHRLELLAFLAVHRLILLHLIKDELGGSVIVYGLYILTVYMQNSVSLFWYIAA